MVPQTPRPPVARSSWWPGLVVVGIVPSSVRKLSSLAILGEKGVLCGLEGGLSRMVPSSGTPAIAFCAKRLLSRLPRPAPPRSEFGEGSRGAELVVLPCAPELWVLWWWRWGKDRARARVRGTSPLTPSESLRDGERKGGGGLPVPPVPPVPRPCLPSRASLPRASASWPLPRRGCAARDACGVLSGCAVVASLPLPRQRSHGWWNRRSPPPPSGPGGPVSRVMGLALGGGPFWGNDGWSRPARRRTSGPAAA